MAFQEFTTWKKIWGWGGVSEQEGSGKRGQHDVQNETFGQR